jgi:hypothetical protein
MRHSKRALIALTLTLFLGWSTTAHSLTTPEILGMVAEGVPEAELIDALRKANKRFELSLTEIAELRLEGVSDAVIDVMLNGAPREAAPPPRARRQITHQTNTLTKSERSLVHLTQRFKSGTSEQALRQLVSKSWGQIHIENGAAKAAVDAGLSRSFLRYIVQRNSNAPCRSNDQCHHLHACTAGKCRKAPSRRSKKRQNRQKAVTPAPEEINALVLASAAIEVFGAESAEASVVGQVGLRGAFLVSDVVYLGADLNLQFSTLADTSFTGLANIGTLVPIGRDATTYIDLHLDLGVSAAGEALFVFGGGLGIAAPVGALPTGVFYLGMSAHGVVVGDAMFYMLRPNLGFGFAF